MRWLLAVATAVALVSGQHAARLLIDTPSGGGNGGLLGGLSVDGSDESKTRLHGPALGLDVLLFEMQTAGGMLRLSPTHWEFEIGDGKWAGTATATSQTLHLNDQLLLQIATSSPGIAAEGSVVVMLPRGKIIARELMLDSALAGQMRVDLCAARAALDGSSPGSACESHREGTGAPQQQLTVQQSLDALSKITRLLATTPRSSSSSQGDAHALNSGLGENQIKDLVRSTFAQELQSSLFRETAQRIDSSRDEVRKECSARVELQAAQVRRQQEELESLLTKQRVALEDVQRELSAVTTRAALPVAAAAPAVDSSRADEKAERNAVSIAVLQSQLDKAETARAASEETVAALRERVSRLEALVEFALKK